MLAPNETRVDGLLSATNNDFDTTVDSNHPGPIPKLGIWRVPTLSDKVCFWKALDNIELSAAVTLAGTDFPLHEET